MARMRWECAKSPMRKFVVLLVFLLIVLVAADRGLHYTAENMLAREIRAQYELSSDPEFTIGGFPFLTQLVSGNYSEITVVTGSFAYGDIQLDRVDVRLNDVEVPPGDMLGGNLSPTAGHVEGTVLIPYSELQRRLPEGIAVEQEGGTPRMSGRVAIAGFDVAVQSDVSLDLDGSTLSVRPSDVEIENVPVDVSAVEEQLAFDIQIPSLPFGLEITDVDLLPNGIEIAGEGDDVPLTGISGQEST